MTIITQVCTAMITTEKPIDIPKTSKLANVGTLYTSNGSKKIVGLVGDPVGAGVVGDLLGESVGEIDGLTVGNELVGAPVGDTVGDTLGDFVGETVSVSSLYK